MHTETTTARKDFDAEVTAAIRAGAFDVEDVVAAGSPRCHDAVGPRERYTCRRCGALISTIYVTTHGPLGGDCLATLTGDASTRARVAKITRKLNSAMLDPDARFRLEPRGGQVSISRIYASGRERCIAVHGGLVAEVLTVIERLAGALGYEPYVGDDGSDKIVNARYMWIGKSN